VPGWLRTSLLVAAALGGALLLWVGFALLVAVLLIVAIPFAIWSAIVRRRAPRGSVTIEGSATRIEEKIVLDQPPAPDSTPGAPPRP
jgi:hypothetical protein